MWYLKIVQVGNCDHNALVDYSWVWVVALDNADEEKVVGDKVRDTYVGFVGGLLLDPRFASGNTTAG